MVVRAQFPDEPLFKPFPKLFGLSLLRSGARYSFMLHADLIVAEFGNLF